MPPPEYLAPVGLILLLCGVTLWLSMLGTFRHLNRERQPAAYGKDFPSPQAGSPHAEEIRLRISPGGRITQVDRKARRLFTQRGGQLTLDSLALYCSPPEDVRRLAAQEGRTVVRIANRLYAAQSRFVGSNGHPAMEILFRPLPVPPPSEQAVEGVPATLLRAALSSLDLSTTANNLLNGLLPISGADWAMITLWDPIQRLLLPESSAAGTSFPPSLTLPLRQIRLEEGPSGALARTRVPIQISDLDSQSESGGRIPPQGPRFRSFLGFPLEISGELIGTLEFYSLTPSAFGKEAVQMLQPAVPVTARALQNAMVHGEQARRTAESESLAEISRAAGTIADPEAFFDRMGKAIARILDVQILGFFLHNESTQALEPQRPFQGAPDHLLAMYRIPLPAGSPALACWQSMEPVLARRSEVETLLREFGILPLAKALKLQDLAFLPMGTIDDSPGWLHVANKNGGPLTEEDLRRLAPLAAQAGRMIRNYLLLEKDRNRLLRAGAIRRVAAYATASVPFNELLQRSVHELADALGTNEAGLFLLEETRGKILLHAESAVGLSEADARHFASVSTADPESRHAATFTQMPFILRDALRAESLPPFYRPWVEHFHSEHLMVAPLLVRGKGIGELLASRRDGAFDPSELEFLTVIAGLLAGTIEREQLFSATDVSLRHRVDQLTALTRISRELNTTIDLPFLLRTLYDEALRVTGADCGRIALLDPHRAARPIRPLLVLGDEPADGVLSNAEADVVASGNARLIQDTDSEQEESDHAGIRSVILVPVIHREKPVGLIHLHSCTPGGFNEESFEITQALGIQLAMAVGNAQRFEEQAQTTEALRRRARLLTTIRQTGRTALAQRPLRKRLESVAQSVQNSLGLTPVVIGILRGRSLEWLAMAGLSDDTWQSMLGMNISRETVFRWAAAGANQDGCFPLPRSPEDADAEQFAAAFTKELASNQIIILPLHSTGGDLIGLLAGTVVSESQPGPDIALLDIFASMATLAIQADLLEQTLTAEPHPSRKTAGMVEAVDESAKAEVQDLRVRLNRLLALVQVTEVLSTQSEPQALLDSFAQQLLKSYSFDTVIIAEEGPGGPRLRLARGNLPAEVQIEMLLGQHNPVFNVLQRGQPLLVTSVEGTAGWQNSPLLAALKANSFLCFPIRTRQKTVAVTLLISQEATSPFQPGDDDLFLLLGDQVAIYLENARLLEETRRRLREGNVLLEFSRQVAALDLPLILQTLVDGTRNAIPEADGAMVALWDPAKGNLAVRAASGYANTQRLRQIACKAGEGLLGQTYAAGKPVHWGRLDMAADFNLRPENLVAYRDGAMGLVPASALGIPLLAGEKILGVLLLENHTTANAFSTGSEEVALSLADQSALALEKARLFEEMTDRTRELDERASHLALLNRLSNAAITTSNELTLLHTACREIASAFDIPQVSAWLIDSQRTASVAAEYMYPGRPSAYGKQIPLHGIEAIEAVLQTRSPMQVEQATSDPRLGILQSWLAQRQTSSIMILPLLVASDAAGFFLLESPENHPFSLGDLALAQTVAAQLGQALENVRLHQSTRRLTTDLEHRVVERSTALEREHRRAEILLRISTELVATLDLEQVINRALQLVNEAVGADQAAIVLLDPETQQLVYRAALEKDSPLPQGGRMLPFHVGEGLAGWVIQQRQPVILPDLMQDPRWVHLYPEDTPRYRSALAVPLIVGADALGALLLLSQDPSVFNPEQLTLASAAANQVAAAINNAELYRLIRDQADRLGGLVRSQQVESRKSRAMLEAIADGVMVTDNGHNIVLFNDAAERVLGLQRERVLGRPAGEFIGLFGRAGRAWLDSLRRWQDKPAEITGGEYLAERITLESGRVLSVHLAPISSGEDFIGSVAVFRDITRDVEVDRLKSEFVATVSHELRTPMTAIKGYVEILLLGVTGPLTDTQRKFLQVVRDNTDRLEALVADLLDVSRIEAGQTRLNLDMIELPEILQKAADDLRERCEKEGKPLEVELELAPDLPAIQADRNRLVEILDNLVDNAFLYTPGGGRVVLRASSTPEGVQIDVADTGIGVTSQERERLFERFFRGEHPVVMATAGTGLGLAITKRLVEMHGGKIWVESEGIPGKGSVFHILLPLEAVES
jgi:PAS domain S-box-containing protein